METNVGEVTREVPSSGVQGALELCCVGPGGVVRRILAPGERIVLGARAGADLLIDDDAVSGIHCALWAEPNGVRFEDLGSRNGVYAGGIRVTGGAVGQTGSGFVVGETLVVVEAGGDLDEGRVEPIPGLVGDSAPMRRLIRQIRMVAPRRASVLVQGESGSGKDLVARAIHDLSGRTGTYVPLNVATIPDSLADSELFGHCRGAFTGAVANRKGAFETAHGGTLFLDEVAELSLPVQGKLLRVVEDGEVRALGGGRPVRVDTRLVCASWVPLVERAALGGFRADLLQRISTLVVEVPPLRQRKGDLPLLVGTLLRRFEVELGARRLSGRALSRLAAHSWPGNVRELAGVVYRAAACSVGPEIGLEAIESALPRARPPRRLERADARRLVEVHRGNVSAAAKAAGVARSTFRFWLEPGGESEC